MSEQAKKLFIALSLFSGAILCAFLVALIFNNKTTPYKEPKTTTAEGVLYGNKNAPTTIELIGYIGCKQCETQSINIRALVDQDENIQLRWFDMPNDSLKPGATTTAVAAECAGNQQAYWEFFDLIANQPQHNTETYIEAAKTLELKEKRFTRCLQKPHTQETIQSRAEFAESKNPTATPTTFIQGKRYTGAMTIPELLSAIAN